MGNWGSTSGTDHALGYYIRIVLATGIIALVGYGLFDAGEEVGAALFLVVAIIGWPLLVTVLLFNEVDRQVSKKLRLYHEAVTGSAGQSNWGSTSGWNHAIAYYIRIFLTAILVTVLIYVLVREGELFLSVIAFLLTTLLWPMILVVLLFNEVDRLTTKRLKAYHERATDLAQPNHWGSTSGWKHATGYYLKVFLSGLAILLIVAIMVEAGEAAGAVLLAILTVLFWGFWVWVLWFRQVDNLLSERLDSYHDQVEAAPRATSSSTERRGKHLSSTPGEDAGPGRHPADDQPPAESRNDSLPPEESPPLEPNSPSGSQPGTDQAPPTQDGYSEHRNRQTQPEPDTGQAKTSPGPRRDHAVRTEHGNQNAGETIDAFEDLPFRAGAVNGLYMLLFGFSIFISLILFSFDDEIGDKPFTFEEATLGDVFGSAIDFFGALFYNAHMVPVENGRSFNFLREDPAIRHEFLLPGYEEFLVPETLLLVFPVLVIGTVSFWRTYRSDFRTPLDGAKAGSTCIVSYLPVVTVGALVVDVHGLSPDLVMSVLVMGVVYPVVFGALGGYLGILGRER